MTQPQQSTLARKWKLQINTGTVASPVWTDVNGVSEFTAGDPQGNLEDDNAYEDGGYTSQTKTALTWELSLTIMRRTIAGSTTTYDVGQEKLRALARTLGSTGVAYVRWFDRDGGAEAYSGFGEVTWEPQGGELTALESINVTIAGKGAPTTIANPLAAALAAPTITSVLTPAGSSTSAAAGGTLMRIVGTNFTNAAGAVAVTGVTGVTLNAVNATSYSVESWSLILVVMPATAAGTRNVVVTNTTGASAGFPITVA